MGGVFSAYLITLGVVGYRWATGPKELPPPMAFLGTTIIFGITGMIAGADKKLGSTLAYGFLLGALVAPKSNLKAVQRLGGVPLDYGVGPDGSKTGPPDSYPHGSTTTDPPPYPGGPTQAPQPGQRIYGAPPAPVPSVKPPTAAVPGPSPSPASYQLTSALPAAASTTNAMLLTPAPAPAAKAADSYSHLSTFTGLAPGTALYAKDANGNMYHLPTLAGLPVGTAIYTKG